MTNDIHQYAASVDATPSSVIVVPPGATFDIRRTTPEDASWIRPTLRRYWASEKVLSRGRVFEPLKLPGFAAMRDSEPVGLITYSIEGDACEIITHNSMADSGGIGSCLLAAVRNEARQKGCSKVWLVTTNDNTPAMRFYQRRDFDIVALHRGAIAENRRLKPEIPDSGLDGIAIRHEVEMAYDL
ncbi:MAG: GNAT family N-acetyltransferase [Planctomycetota bacterium]